MSYAALPVLRTPRLELRPLTEDDAHAIVEGVGNYDVSRWLGRVPYPYGSQDASDFIERVRGERLPIWGIENAHGLIGTVGLDEELGYWLARPAWRKGYGFEAARAVVDYWFSDPGASDLHSGHYNDNHRSRLILKCLGFVEAGQSPRYARSLGQEVPGTDVILSRKSWEARRDFTLYTPRLVLRPLKRADAAPIAAMTMPEVTRMLSKLRTGMTEAEVIEEELPRRRWRGYLGFTLGIEHQGMLIGTIGIGGTPHSLGYFLSPDHWGRGLMTEALSAFAPEIFDRFPITRVHADHFEDNPASGAILRKLGFRETGREMGTSLARLEQAPLITYAVERSKLKVPV